MDVPLTAVHEPNFEVTLGFSRKLNDVFENIGFTKSLKSGTLFNLDTEGEIF